ncbi:hypothetical protein SLEP1_g54990 [Rubroshorea leprosula]|uniref:Uncharacterized protein n=1 Tax=Rubroshorea leprosula TaxID=152421 RepID=A0AAV5MG93_9ROSI|nr:hypothetical protein SLEP1_g54990 [Rubroshorea leprosula]
MSGWPWPYGNSTTTKELAACKMMFLGKPTNFNFKFNYCRSSCFPF